MDPPRGQGCPAHGDWVTHGDWVMDGSLARTSHPVVGRLGVARLEVARLGVGHRGAVVRRRAR